MSSKVYVKDGEYLYNFPGTKDSKEKYGDIVFKLFFGRDRSNNKIIVDRIVQSVYKMCNSTIQYDGKDIFLFLTVDIPITINEKISEDKVMGIDLGINRPVAIYIEGERRQPRQLEINDKIQHERMRLLKQRKGIQASLKHARGGHGSTKKLKKLEDFRNKEKNWAQTINHLISANVINLALEYGVGTIKMEDLTGITTNANDYFLKSWAYYQLQNYIKYKAEKEGIKVVWVNPKDTSRECPTCNQVHEDNRSKENVTHFSCKNEFCEDYMVMKDADLVAACNISRRLGQNEKPKSKKGRLAKNKIEKKYQQ